ncbi:hypothetical protein LEP1GSC074_1286 [Leptospira noguchii str. Hook]|nr:hypothetical protein LEP1GSC074_1286 [Leptospira noguchii str. Hook]
MQKVCFSDREKSSELLHLRPHPKRWKLNTTLSMNRVVGWELSFTENLS